MLVKQAISDELAKGYLHLFTNEIADLTTKFDNVSLSIELGLVEGIGRDKALDLAFRKLNSAKKLYELNK